MSFARGCWDSFSGAASYAYTKVTSAGTCIKTAYQTSYAKTVLKGTLAAANIIAVPLCFSGRTYFSAASFLGYLSESMTPDNPVTMGIAGTFAVGSLIFTVACRSKPIYRWYFPVETKAEESKLPAPATSAQQPPAQSTPSTQAMRLEASAPQADNKVAEQKTALSQPRWAAGWTVRLFCDAISIMQMLSTDMVTYLGLEKILALFFPEDTVTYIGLAALGFFDVNYIAFNLDAAFSNSKKFQIAINTGNYDFNNRSFAFMMLCMLPVIFSIPTGGFFSAKNAIPLLQDALSNNFIPALGNDDIMRLSYTAAAVNLLSCGPMTMPSIYNAIQNGIKLHVPPDDTPWVRKLTCDLAHNKWRLLRNLVMVPFGTMDNIGSGAFAASGFAYTVADISWIPLGLHSGGTIAMIVVVGVSSVISTFAFVTLRSYYGIVDEHLKQTVVMRAPDFVLSAEPAQPLEGVVLGQPRDRRSEFATPALPEQQAADEKSGLLAGAVASDALTYGAVVPFGTHRNLSWNERRASSPLLSVVVVVDERTPPSPTTLAKKS